MRKRRGEHVEFLLWNAKRVHRFDTANSGVTSGLVQQRHFAEVLSRAKLGKDPLDAIISANYLGASGEDDIHAVAKFALVEYFLAGLVMLFGDSGGGGELEFCEFRRKYKIECP